MDLKFLIRISIIFCMFSPVLTELQILVDNGQCGRVINLAEEQALYLKYEGAELGFQEDSACLINITNDRDDEMVCLREVSSIPDKHCDQALVYYIENMSTKQPQMYDCSHFNEKPLCHRNSRSFIMFKQHDGKLNLKIYTRTFYNKTTGAIATAIGGAIAFILFVLCMGAYVKSRNNVPHVPTESGYQQEPGSDVGPIFNTELPTDPSSILFSPPPYFSEPPPPYSSGP